MIRSIGGLLAMSLVLISALPASGTDLQPLDALRGPVEEVLAILHDPAYRTETGKTAQKERLWVIIRSVFDFRGISARAVGRNWKKFDPAQKQAFADVFADLLGNTYLDKIQSSYKNEKVEFLSQEFLTPTIARVKTKILREVDAVPVDYSMHLENGAWTIYDVNIEGVSLVQNYRSQFDQILAKESPDELIERVRAKRRPEEKP